MDFFNKLGKKASETYQVTKEKTVKFSEEMKLKSKISEAKNKITNLYEEIGQCVYNQFKTNLEEGKEEILQKCEEIANQFDEISKLETQILALKEVKKCTKCGAEIGKKDIFCSKCGKEQPQTEKVEIKIEVEEQSQQEVKEAEVTEIKDVPNKPNAEQIENQEEQ